MRIGDKAKLGWTARPAYLQGQEVKIVGFTGKGNVYIEIAHAVGRFSPTQRINCPPAILFPVEDLEGHALDEWRRFQGRKLVEGDQVAVHYNQQNLNRAVNRTATVPEMASGIKRGAADGRTKYSSETPDWVRLLVEKVKEDYDVYLVNVVWSPYRHRGRTAVNDYSRGTSWKSRGQIALRFGTDPRAHRMVVLHELAHLIALDNVGHYLPFWLIAWKLYKEYGAIDTQEEEEFVYLHEFKYKRTSADGYREVMGRWSPIPPQEHE